MTRTWWARGALAALVAAVLAGAAAADLKVGTAAPDFNGTTVAGKAISLSQYKGKVVLLNFFSKY